MKKIILLLFLLFFSLFIFPRENSSTFNHFQLPEPILRNEWIFPVDYNASYFLFLQGIKENGYFIPPHDFGDLYLKDSFLADPIFYQKCTGSFNVDQSLVEGDGNFNDHYDPLRLKTHIKSENVLERLVFYFNNNSYTSLNNPSLKVFSGELLGYKTPIWTQNIWTDIIHESLNQKRIIFMTHENIKNFYEPNTPHRKSYDKMIENGKFIEFDRYKISKINEIHKFSKYESNAYFKKINLFAVPLNKHFLTIPSMSEENENLMEKLLSQSSLPVKSPDFNKNISYSFPIMLIDPDSHCLRIDKDDWCIYTYLNYKSGDFFQYFFFEKELEYAPPLFLRNWAVDYLAGVHICKKSTIGVLLNNKTKIIRVDIEKTFKPSGTLIALDNGKQWHPPSVPANKNDIPQNRLFYQEYPGRIFGSYSKVWELGIWERLGMMFKLNPKAEIYLCGYGTLLQAAETKTVEEEHALIKKCGVRMTAELYSELEKLRKSQK